MNKSYRGAKLSITSQKIEFDFLSEENILINVLPEYNLEKSIVTQIKFKDTDKQRAVYKIENLDTVYCLKKVYYDENDLLFVYSAIEWFYHFNIGVSRILSTKRKDKFVKYNDMLFILTNWIYGYKCNYDNLEHVSLCCSNLAKMHLCSQKFKPINENISKISYENLFIETNKHFQQLLSASNLAFKYKDKFSKMFIEYFDIYFNLSLHSIKLASTINFDKLKKSLCHLDYVNKNIIFDENMSLWVIDFDKCKMDYSVHDISYFLRRLLKRDSTKWDTSIAIECLKKYEKLSPLNLDEFKYILAYLAFPQKYWKLSRDYFNNITKCNQTLFCDLLSKSVENSENHIQFIYQMEGYIEERFHTKL